MPDVRIGYRPFDQQVAYFLRKINMPSARWDDLMHGEHAHGFMAAGVARMDILDDVRQAMHAAIADGEGYRAFADRMKEIIARKGWIGGAGNESDARRAWRMRTIYQTNLRTSYMAGRWEQLKSFPYLQYQHNTVNNPREQHLAWDDKVLATADPWWDTHYPPNGWGCRCSVTGVGKGRMAAMGKDGPDPTPGPGPGDPPPEWAYHVGKSARSMKAAESFGRKVMQLPPEWRKAALDDAQRRNVQWFGDWAAHANDVATTLHAQSVSPVGFIADDILTAAAQDVVRRRVVAGIAPPSSVLAVADRQIVHALHDLPAGDRAIVAATIADLPALIARPDHVYRQASPDRLVYTRTLEDGRSVAAYFRLDAVPARPGKNRVESNWLATVEIRTAAEMADYVLLK